MRAISSMKDGQHPILGNAKVLYFLMAALIITDWMVPSYFGIHIGFDFTVTRILNIIIVAYFIYNRRVGNHFMKSILEVQITPFISMYMFVMVYTTVLRVNINTFFLNFLDILTFYMVFYGIRYVVGLKRVINWTIIIAYFFGIYGMIEYVLKFSPMVRYMLTLSMSVKMYYRSGQYRIMGPCLHSIGYGMMLFFLIAIACVDYEKDEVYLFKRPVLLCLLILNVFLTGSRGTLGIAVLEIMLIILFTRGERRKRTFFFLLVAAAGFGVFLLAVYNTSLGRYIMVQITSVIDEVFGTSLAVNYGADVTWLEQSSDYRTLLPKIFQVEWLNPLLGKGANAHITFAIDGRYLKSIDNYYVALYIRYSYPGLITAVLIHAASIFHMMRTGLKYKSGLSILCGISIFVYTISLYWVDYLMTTRYMYIIIAMYAVLYAERYLELDRANRKKKRIKKI